MFSIRVKELFERIVLWEKKSFSIDILSVLGIKNFQYSSILPLTSNIDFVETEYSMVVNIFFSPHNSLYKTLIGIESAGSYVSSCKCKTLFNTLKVLTTFLKSKPKIMFSVK